ncbi:MAG: ISLre2 family transposase [Firmicutes bacterium]|nr:ISLre2 family transposase [Bacillota bacterium]
MEHNWEGNGFERLEAMVFRLTLLIIRQALEGILEDMDKYLAVVRDKSRYEAEEIEERVLDTLVGTIRFKRRSYRDRETGRRVHLLDEKLKIKGYQRVSEGLVKVAVSLAAAGPSYRNARDRLKELIGEEILSHEGIRQLVLKTSEVIKEAALEKTSLQRREVLFIEADGLWTGKQGKKNKRGKKKKEETKFAVVHEGWRPRYAGSREYETITTFRYIQTKGSREDFWVGLYGKLAEAYALGTTMVVINGDGAEWIRKGTDYFPCAIYQYDRFHISREVAKALKWDEGLKKEALQALRDNDLGGLMQVLDGAIIKADKKHKGAVERVRDTVRSDWEHIIDYRLRLKALGYNCETFRGLGSGESNVGKFKSRTRGRSWSSEGLEALGNVLFKLVDGSLGIYTSCIRSRFQEHTAKIVATGAEVVKKAVLQCGAGVKKGHFPCLERGTEGYAQLFRQILKEGFVV